MPCGCILNCSVSMMPENIGGQYAHHAHTRSVCDAQTECGCGLETLHHHRDGCHSLAKLSGDTPPSQGRLPLSRPIVWRHSTITGTVVTLSPNCLETLHRHRDGCHSLAQLSGDTPPSQRRLSLSRPIVWRHSTVTGTVATLSPNCLETLHHHRDGCHSLAQLSGDTPPSQGRLSLSRPIVWRHSTVTGTVATLSPNCLETLRRHRDGCNSLAQLSGDTPPSQGRLPLSRPIVWRHSTVTGTVATLSPNCLETLHRHRDGCHSLAQLSGDTPPSQGRLPLSRPIVWRHSTITRTVTTISPNCLHHSRWRLIVATQLLLTRLQFHNNKKGKLINTRTMRMVLRTIFTFCLHLLFKNCDIYILRII